MTFVPYFDDIEVDYDPGTTQEVTMHDGSRLLLKKVAENYDPTHKAQALRLLRETAERGVFATGILYVERDRPSFVDLLNIVDEPLATLPLERVRPSREALETIMESLR